jgi:hypothetical protein
MTRRLLLAGAPCFALLALLSCGAPARASYALYDFDLGPWVRLTTDSDFSYAQLAALSYNIYHDTASSGGSPVCSSGACGYPAQCYNGTQCGGGKDGNGDFSGRVDSEHGFGEDDANFASGYPGQLVGSEGGKLSSTALQVCKILNAVDIAGYSGVNPDGSITAQATGSDDPGDDGGTRNTALYTGSGWDLLESNHTYNGVLNGNTARYAMQSLSCLSTAKPYQSLTINGGSSTTVKPGQSASLTWADNDFYAAAAQTCTASVSPAGATAFVVPTPAAIVPQPSESRCTAAGGEFVQSPKATSDPGQTSTLMSAPRDSATGNPMYTYSCNKSETPWFAPGCTITYNDDSCSHGEGSTCSKTVECDVTLPANTIQVSADSPGTYTYDYACTNRNGTTHAQAQLIVSGASISGNCSEDPAAPINPGDSVSFTASASGGSGSYTYSWSGDDGLSGSKQSISHTYDDAGTYGNNQVVVTDQIDPNVHKTLKCDDVEVESTAPDLKGVGSVSYTPSTVRSGVTEQYTQSVKNAGEGATGVKFPVLFEYATDSLGDNLAALGSANAAKLGAGSSENVSFSYATTTVGTFYIRACANMDTNFKVPPKDGSGVQNETETGNNCGSWTKIKVQPFQVACASNSPIDSGAQGKWTASVVGGTAPFTYAWNYDGNSDCGDGTAGSSNSCKTTLYNPPTATAHADVAVVDANGNEVDVDSGSCAPISVTAGSCGAGTPTITLTPTRVAAGTKVDLSWGDTAQDSSSCMLTKNDVDTGWESDDEVEGCSIQGSHEGDVVGEQTKYCFSCAGDSGPPACATVNVPPGFQEY